MIMVNGMKSKTDKETGKKYWTVEKGYTVYEVAEALAKANGGSIGFLCPNWVEVRLPDASPVYINRK